MERGDVFLNIAYKGVGPNTVLTHIKHSPHFQATPLPHR
jgi:hypothetical protein